jgi:hypothetical protein
MRDAILQSIALAAMVALAACDLEKDDFLDDDDCRWSVVELRPFEGAPIGTTSIDCVGLPCGTDDTPPVASFESPRCGLPVLRVGAPPAFEGIFVELHLEPEPSYALVRVVSYSEFEAADEHPVSGWVMLEQWNDRAVAVGRFAWTAADDSWIRGRFDTRGE